jgi:hypothetical protein
MWGVLCLIILAPKRLPIAPAGPKALLLQIARMQIKQLLLTKADYAPEVLISAAHILTKYLPLPPKFRYHCSTAAGTVPISAIPWLGELLLSSGREALQPKL